MTATVQGGRRGRARGGPDGTLHVMTDTPVDDAGPVVRPAPAPHPAAGPASADAVPASEPEGTLARYVRTASRFGVAFAGAYLLFLAPTFGAAWSARQTAAGAVGLLLTVGFCLVYLAIFAFLRSTWTSSGPVPLGAPALALLASLGLGMALTLGPTGLGASVFVGVAAVMLLGFRAAVLTCLALVVVTEGVARAVLGWSDASGISLSILASCGAMFGVRSLTRRNVELIVAREENERLAVENERSRIARDLHDILGHSLTVITVKAELAGRLLEGGAPAERVRREIADLERLSRDALGDVRRTAAGFRELTLPGELARARLALDAAGIKAVLPNSTDEVDSGLREVFAWAVREGVTNVVRHSAASECTVRLGRTSVSILDDGRGPASGPEPVGGSADGAGLAGLRERAVAVGATVAAGSLAPHGYALVVSLPEATA